jgi:hypothetical protein
LLVQGFNNVNAVLKGGSDYAAVLLVQILIAKILVTSLCRGSGEDTTAGCECMSCSGV